MPIFLQLLAFDLAANDFVKVTTKRDPVHGMPEGRKCHGLVEYAGKVYVFGGCRDIEDQSTMRVSTAEMARICLNWSISETVSSDERRVDARPGDAAVDQRAVDASERLLPLRHRHRGELLAVLERDHSEARRIGRRLYV